MTASRQHAGALVSAAAGILLIISLFLPWYSATAAIGERTLSVSATGWKALSSIDVLLCLVAVVAVAVAGALAARVIPEQARALATLAIAALGVVALILVVYRLIEIPGADEASSRVDFGRRIGLFVALVAAVGMGGGGLTALGWGTAERGEAREPAGAPGPFTRPQTKSHTETDPPRLV